MIVTPFVCERPRHTRDLNLIHGRSDYYSHSKTKVSQTSTYIWDSPANLGVFVDKKLWEPWGLPKIATAEPTLVTAQRLEWDNIYHQKLPINTPIIHVGSSTRVPSIPRLPIMSPELSLGLFHLEQIWSRNTYNNETHNPKTTDEVKKRPWLLKKRNQGSSKPKRIKVLRNINHTGINTEPMDNRFGLETDITASAEDRILTTRYGQRFAMRNRPRGGLHPRARETGEARQAFPRSAEAQSPSSPDTPAVYL